MSALGDWLTAYLAALPDTIRGSLDDRRLIEAARMAMHHGWHPQRAARAVAARSYHGTRNPPLIAVIRLEEIAPYPPGTSPRARRTPHPNGCQVCAPNQTCEDPTTEAIPDDWARERMALIRRLARTPDIGDERREQATAALIAEQRSRTWSTSG